jgi:Domain of unknown function (DUF4365)
VKRGAPKSLPSRIRRGQLGINLIERIVLEMGSSWSATGALDVGIDGTIELFDPGSQTALGKILGVQSKVVANPKNETDEGFDYYCEERDLNYWLQGNMPVVLIVSQPERGEAFWLSIKDYFNSPERRRARKLHFSKHENRFDANALNALLRVGAGSSAGLYLGPAPKRERLISNLLEVAEFPQTIWVGVTDCSRPYHVWKLLEASGTNRHSGDWILHEDSIVSFQNLSEPPWTDICDAGTCEPFNATEWAFSTDPDRRRQFVALMNTCLEDQLRGDIRYSQHEECFLFRGNLTSAPIRRGYRSAKRKSEMTVVALYKWTSKRTEQTFQCLRHLAFRRQFRLFDERWYLEITPTYVFTADGMLLDRYNEDLLKKIKQIEGNRAVLSPLLFWADYLSSKHDLLRAQDARRLKFGPLVEVELPVGIVDKAWSAVESEYQLRTNAEGSQGVFEVSDFL